MKILLRWVFVTMVLPWMADWSYLEPLNRIATALTAPRVERAATLRGEPGHGAFCQSPGEPHVFLGRDLPQISSYSVFEAWCVSRGGEVDWKG